MRTFYPGDKVKVFDYLLFKDDITTPLAVTMQPATVVMWYGKLCHCIDCHTYHWKYSSLIDVIFDHDGRRSNGHFTRAVEIRG